MAFVPNVEYLAAQAHRGRDWAIDTAREALAETEKLDIPWKELTFVAGAFAIAAALAWADRAEGAEGGGDRNHAQSFGRSLPSLPNLKSLDT